MFVIGTVNAENFRNPFGNHRQIEPWILSIFSKIRITDKTFYGLKRKVKDRIWICPYDCSDDRPDEPERKSHCGIYGRDQQHCDADQSFVAERIHRSGQGRGSLNGLQEARSTLNRIIANLSDISGENATATEQTNASMEELSSTFQLINSDAEKLRSLAAELTETISYFHWYQGGWVLSRLTGRLMRQFLQCRPYYGWGDQEIWSPAYRLDAESCFSAPYTQADLSSFRFPYQ